LSSSASGSIAECGREDAFEQEFRSEIDIRDRGCAGDEGITSHSSAIRQDQSHWCQGGEVSEESILSFVCRGDGEEAFGAVVVVQSCHQTPSVQPNATGGH